MTNRDADQNPLRQSLITCALAVCAYLFTTHRIDETICWTLVMALFASITIGDSRKLLGFCWIIVSIGFAIGILQRPLDVPNHHWMMTYLSAAIALALLFNQDTDDVTQELSESIRWLIVVLMGFATLQKLLSTNFMDSSYIAFEVARGGFAAPVLKFIPAIYEPIQENIELVNNLHATPPGELGSVILNWPIPGFKAIAYGFTFSILAMEAWLFLGMLCWPKKYITHISLIAFATTLAVLRQEFTFISIVCSLGLLSCGAELRYCRYAYVTLAIVTAAGVLQTSNYG